MAWFQHRLILIKTVSVCREVLTSVHVVCHQGLIVDQTIEKVSFCAPDRNHEKGFAYICRDGTTRRWMCHGFLAIKESVCCLCALSSVFCIKISIDHDGNVSNVTLLLNVDHILDCYLLKFVA